MNTTDPKSPTDEEKKAYLEKYRALSRETGLEVSFINNALLFPTNVQGVSSVGIVNKLDVIKCKPEPSNVIPVTDRNIGKMLENQLRDKPKK